MEASQKEVRKTPKKHSEKDLKMAQRCFDALTNQRKKNKGEKKKLSSFFKPNSKKPGKICQKCQQETDETVKVIFMFTHQAYLPLNGKWKEESGFHDAQ